MAGAGFGSAEGKGNMMIEVKLVVSAVTSTVGGEDVVFVQLSKSEEGRPANRDTDAVLVNADRRYHYAKSFVVSVMQSDLMGTFKPGQKFCLNLTQLE